MINEMHNLEGKTIYICISKDKDNAKKEKNMIEIEPIAFSIISHERAGKKQNIICIHRGLYQTLVCDTCEKFIKYFNLKSVHGHKLINPH